MVYELREQQIFCPYCGESITLLIDCSVSPQNYIEDCHVCCQPIEIGVAIDPDGEPEVSVASDNE